MSALQSKLVNAHALAAKRSHLWPKGTRHLIFPELIPVDEVDASHNVISRVSIFCLSSLNSPLWLRIAGRISFKFAERVLKTVERICTRLGNMGRRGFFDQQGL